MEDINNTDAPRTDADINPVKWGMGGDARYGNRVWGSKCGRFSIVRREYDLMGSSVCYHLTDDTNGDRTECDLLRDAKEYADHIASYTD